MDNEKVRSHSEKTIELLSSLSHLRQQIPGFGKSVFQAGGSTMFQLDMIVAGILNRCMSTSSAIELLVKQWNMTSARAVLRVHLDTAVRLSAFWRVEDPHRLAKEVIAGKHLKTFKDRYGKKMEDGYLVNKLNDQYPWVKQVYSYTCGYVHFSDMHFFDVIQDVNSEDMSFSAYITAEQYKFPEESWIEILQYACEILGIVISHLEGYRIAKDSKKDC